MRYWLQRIPYPAREPGIRAALGRHRCLCAANGGLEAVCAEVLHEYIPIDPIHVPCEWLYFLLGILVTSLSTILLAMLVIVQGSFVQDPRFGVLQT